MIKILAVIAVIFFAYNAFGGEEPPMQHSHYELNKVAAMHWDICLLWAEFKPKFEDAPSVKEVRLNDCEPLIDLYLDGYRLRATDDVDVYELRQ